MRLNPANFNRFLTGDVVQKFGWQRSSSCPCVNPNSGAAKPACPVCSGLGIIWAAEVIDSAAMTGMNQKRGFAMFGTWEPGDALLTIPSSAAFYCAGQYDKFRALNSTHRFSEILTRTGTEKLKGTVVTNTFGEPAIDQLFWLSPDGTTVVDGEIPDSVVAGVPTWGADQTAPPMGVSYSVQYTRYDVYFCYLDLPSNRNSGVDGLPKKLPVRSFDLYGRSG